MESASVEARWVASPWWQEGLVAAILVLIAGPVTAEWLRVQFPGAPLVSLAGSHANRGRAYFALKQYEKATADFEKAKSLAK